VVDRNSAAGAGSTSASSAIVRFNYSTWEGVAISWEAKQCWADWEDHLGHVDPSGMVRYLPTGGMVFDFPGFDLDRLLKLYERAGIPAERLSPTQLAERFPYFDGRSTPTARSRSWADPMDHPAWAAKRDRAQPPDEATEASMRARITVVAVIAVFVATACGSPSAAPEASEATQAPKTAGVTGPEVVETVSPMPSPSETPREATDPLASPSTPLPTDQATDDGSGPVAAADAPSALEPALLVLDDLPDGWEEVDDEEPAPSDDPTEQTSNAAPRQVGAAAWLTASQDDPSQDEGSGDGDGGGQFALCGRDDVGQGIDLQQATDGAARAFRKSFVGPYLANAVGSLPQGQVETLLDELAAAGDSCDEWTETDEDGNEVQFTIERIDLDDLVDQTVAFHLTASRDLLRFETDLVLYRVGDAAGMIIHAGADTTVDATVTRDAYTTAAPRLSEIIRAT